MLEQAEDVKYHRYTKCNKGLYRYQGKEDDSAMEVEFGDDDLDRLETDARFTAGLAAGVVSAYRKRMQMIRSAPDERDFYQLKSLHFEKLKGNRSHQNSMRLNAQFRLIVELRGKGTDKVVYVVGIEDYH
jgi:proteic killer suppression protein